MACDCVMPYFSCCDGVTDLPSLEIYYCAAPCDDRFLLLTKKYFKSELDDC